MTDIVRTQHEAMDLVAGDTDTILLAFSGGKDCLAAWLVLRERFNVVPYHMYLVPNLKFVEKIMSHYEQFFQTRIRQYPHHNFFNMFAGAGLFQPPHRLDYIANNKMPKHTADTVRDMAAEDAGLQPGTWTADGVRVCDSLNRRAAIKRSGYTNNKRKTFHPVADMTNSELRALLKRHGVKLSVEYRWYGRSFDGLQHYYMDPIRRYAPEDYETIKEWFPLIDLQRYRQEVWRYGYKDHINGKGYA